MTYTVQGRMYQRVCMQRAHSKFMKKKLIQQNREEDAAHEKLWIIFKNINH
jgi:hypothetical protein